MNKVNQCTMLLSIELEISEICKSKAPVFAQFRSKIIKTSFNRCKTVQRFTEKYFLQILLKNVGFIGKKPEQGMREMWNLVGNLIFLCSTKNLKITFFSRAPFNVQIFQKYFTNIFICQIIIKYLEPVFTDHIQLVPQSFSHPSCSLLESQLILLQILLLHMAVFN